MKKLWMVWVFAGLSWMWAGDHWQVGLDLVGGFPQGEFQDSLDDDGVGGGIWFLYGPKDRPFSVGADFAFVNYGYTSEDVDCRRCDLEEINTSSNILLGHFLFRIQPNHGVIRPYLETLLGFKHFVTTTTFVEDDFEDSDYDEELDDTAPSYGLGAGVSFLLSEPKKQGPEWQFAMSARYLFGEKAEYILADSVEIIDQTVYYESAESKTDLLTVQVGFSCRF